MEDKEFLVITNKIKKAISETLHKSKPHLQEVSPFVTINLVTNTIVSTLNLDNSMRDFIKSLVVEEYFTPAREQLS